MNKPEGKSSSRCCSWLARKSGTHLIHFAWLVLGLQSELFAQTPATPASPPQAINISAVRVEGNTLLPERVISDLTAGVAGGQRTLPELNQVAARLQTAYRDAGYGGVVVYLPEQDIASGNIVFRVVEGKIATVHVAGNAHFDTPNIRAGLPNLREGTTPVVGAIDRDIQLTNENPAKDVKVTLTPGLRPGEINADVDVTDSRPLQFLFGANNTGNEETGHDRVAVGVQHSNLFGRDHVGTLQYQTSLEQPGRVHIYSAGYRVPLYGQAASLDVFAAYSNVKNGTTFTPAGPLTFGGQGTVVGIRANRSLDRVGEYAHRVTVGIDGRDYENECILGNFGPEACGSAGVSVTAVPLLVAYAGQKQSPDLSWAFNTSLSVNAGGSSQATYESARPQAERNYVIARFSGSGDIPAPSGFLFSARLDLQYSPHALIPGEQYGMGGVGSVRGYVERELAADSGFVVRLEGAARLFSVGESFNIRPYLFLDHGRLYNNKNFPCRSLNETSCSLTGAGIGARMSFGRYASAGLDIARAMKNGITTSSGDWRGHVSVSFVY
jgi:hemolysin activation/secretion protein